MKKYAILLVICLLSSIGHVNPQAWSKIIPEIFASDVAIDAQGNKWFATYDGVTKFNGTNCKTYQYIDGLASDWVYAIAIDKQGHIVIGTISGVSEFDGTTWKTYRREKDGMPCEFIVSIAIDTLNNKWFGTDGCGLLKFDGTTWSCQTWSNSDTVDNPPPPMCIVDAIAIDAQGDIWYSCNACALVAFTENIPAYLVKYDGTTWTKYTTSEYLYNYINAITIDVQGNVWVGTAGGLFKFDGENWTKYTTANGLPGNGIAAITVDKLGNIWVGMFEGLSKFDGTTWTTYNNSFGWDENSIHDIAIDNQGNIWLATWGGVVKFSEGTPILSAILNNQNVGFQTGKTTFNITSNINWTISDDADWLTVYPTSGFDNRTITVNFNANTLASSRVATIIITGSGKSDTVTVTQGIKILWGLPDNLYLSFEAGDSTFIITSNNDWTISDDADWLTVSPICGSGNDTLTINFTENTSTSPRVAIITIYGPGINTQYHTVTQVIKNLTVLPNNLDASYEAGDINFIITSNIDWTISDDADWLAVSQTSGRGNDTITINLEANTLSSSRTANITISGTGVDSQIVIVSQAGIIRLSVLPYNKLNIESEAGDTTFYITSNIEYAISDNVDWLTVSPTNSTGNDTITVHFEANTSLIFARNATITIKGTGIKSQTVNITQAPIKILTVLPNNLEVCSEAGDTNLIITSNTSWAVSYKSDWLTVSSISGVGNCTITINLEANNYTSPRVATITITGKGVDSKTITVTQDGFLSVPSLYNSKVTVYPNPANDITIFKIENNYNRKVHLEIFDFSGRLIGEKTSTAERMEFDFLNYSSGIYFYKLRNSEGIIGAGKVIKN